MRKPCSMFDRIRKGAHGGTSGWPNQLALERSRAHAMLGWLVAAGLVYAVFGLVVFWSDYSPAWLFGPDATEPNVRSAFVNRNHYAGLAGMLFPVVLGVFLSYRPRVQYTSLLKKISEILRG